MGVELADLSAYLDLLWTEVDEEPNGNASRL